MTLMCRAHVSKMTETRESDFDKNIRSVRLMSPSPCLRMDHMSNTDNFDAFAHRTRLDLCFELVRLVSTRQFLFLLIYYISEC